MKSIRLLIAPLAFALLGMQDQPWGPLGNGRLEHEDDITWTFFHDVKIAADDKRGVYRATFGKSLLKMEGRPFKITGYMLTVEPTTRSPHFILTRRSTGCPFCPPNELSEVIEVRAEKPVQYTQDPVTIEGRLHFAGSSATGLFYQLNKARQL